MPRSFNVLFESSATVEQIHAAFGSEDYWMARHKHFGGSKVLESLAVDPDGTVTVAVSEDLRHGGLPGILTAVYRGDLNIVGQEVWVPAGDGTVNGEINVAVRGAPGSGRGTVQLTRKGTGSQLNLAATVVFKVPLLGGSIESFIAREFAGGIGRIQQFTTAWIAEHA